MGYLRHECVVVNGWDANRVGTAHAAATSIFNECGIGSLVGGVTRHVMNGGAAFMIAPDGSKEGWPASDNGSKARSEFINWLKSDDAKDLYLDWSLVLVETATMRVIADNLLHDQALHYCNELEPRPDVTGFRYVMQPVRAADAHNG